MNEFALIRKYFQRPPRRVRLGVGDDCALLTLVPGEELAISTDMLVAGRHFFSDVGADALGWKSLAVNLSDLAAMGAAPRAFTLALALPAVDEAWLAAFSRGLFDCAERYDCELIGGDTTRGPLTISITVLGACPSGGAVRRSGARAGDDVWVSGTLGGAAFALSRLRDGRATSRDAARDALERPTPRVALGIALRGIASAMIDLSDGLVGDLAPVLEASQVGATLFVNQLPMPDVVAAEAEARRLAFALGGGDDYELCFTAPASARAAALAAGANANVAVTRIGAIDREIGLRFVDADGSSFRFQNGFAPKSFDHFA